MSLVAATYRSSEAERGTNKYICYFVHLLQEVTLSGARPVWFSGGETGGAARLQVGSGSGTRLFWLMPIESSEPC